MGWAKTKRGHVVLDAAQARMTFFAMPYKHVLDHFVREQIAELQQYISQGRAIVFVDTSICTDIGDESKELSHAWLLKCYLEGSYPSENIGSQDMLNDSIHL
jgi:hypothetical protein